MTKLTRDFEFRSGGGDGDDGFTLTGYAAVFNQDTQIRSWEGTFTERIAPGAFRKTLRENPNVMMQFNHGHDVRVGTVPIGRFTEMREDEQGLFVQGRLNDNDVVEPIRQALVDKQIPGMSFRFIVVRDEWADKDGKKIRSANELAEMLYNPDHERGPLQRTIKELRISEAGPVTSPAYPQTSVGVRSAEDLGEAERADIAASYVRTAQLESEERSDDHSDHVHFRSDDVEAWLEAERAFNWLEAERTHQWLEAEKAHAAKTPSDADRQVTSLDTPKSDAAKSTSEKRDIPTKSKKKEARVMTLAELREHLAVLQGQRDALNDEYGERAMSDEDQATFDKLTSDAERTERQIKAIEKRLAEAKGNVSERTIDGAPGFRKSVDEDELHDMDAIRASARSLDDLVVKKTDAAKRIAERMNWATTERTESKDHAIYLLDKDYTGELAERMINAGSKAYERAWSKYAAGKAIGGLTFEEQRALQLGSDPDGGFAVPVQLDPTVIWTSAGVVNPIRSLATVKTITGKEYQGVTSGGTTVSRSLEGAEFAENTWTLGQPTIRTERVTGYTTFTYEAEAWNAIREEIVFALRDAKDREEAESYTNGNGTSPAPFGLVSTHAAPNLVDTAVTAAFSDVDLYAVKEALDPRYRAGAVWMMDEGIVHQIRMWAQNDGPDLIQRIDGPNPDRLLGFSVHENFNMSSALTAGTKIAVFGDLKGYYIVDRVGMSIEVNQMVLGPNRRPTGQRGIAAYWMNNAKWWVPGSAKTLKIKA